MKKRDNHFKKCLDHPFDDKWPLDPYKDSILARLIEIRSSENDSDSNIEKLEEEISCCPVYSILYAITTGKPFPKGEDAIAKNPWTACRYATDIIKSRFLKCEIMLASVRPGDDMKSDAAVSEYMEFLMNRDPIVALTEDAKYGSFSKLRSKVRRKINKAKNDSN